jgi:hypothetical protein
MDNLKLEGTVVQLLDAQQGEGANGAWKKQEFIIETSGKYPKKISIIGFQDMADKVSNLKNGDNVEVSVNIESREYNSRWYTDIKAWKIDKVGVTTKTSAPKETNTEEEVPF